MKSFCPSLKIAAALLALPLLPACRTVESRSAPAAFDGATPLQWSVRLADSEIARRDDKLAWRAGGKAKWDYTAGLFTLSLLKLNRAVPTPGYVTFTTNAIGSFITDDGDIRGYKPGEYQLDAVNPGKTVLALWQLTREPRYRKCAATLRLQLTTQPRTREGGFWHKERYPEQMWLDGLYMAAPFYAEYARQFNEPAGFDDAVKQFQLADAHLYDARTGLYYHGWDEKHVQEWANPVTGTSSNFWGRGLGWFAMAQVDVLDYLPKNHPGRAVILAMLQKTARGMVRWQDPASGLWWQVLDQGGRPGNYLEATASSMFVYSLAKAVNRGYLPRTYVPAIVKGYAGLIREFVRDDGNGQISLTHCCAVAGLGYGRDGSYAYYLREPVVDNDLKGVGPFILAGLELQQLLDLPGRAEHAPAAAARGAQSAAPEWSELPALLARIRPPAIPAREFSIADFGATGNGQTDSSAAIARAIAAAAAAGGGRVIVPAGEYLTGPIHLQSRIELHLEGGATLKFKTDPSAGLPAVRTWFEGMECLNYSPLIYAFEAEDIAITGDGVLDGQADETHWWPWKGKKEYGWTSGQPKQDAARKRLVKMVAEGTPVAQRTFGDGDYLRPSFIEPFRCRNVLIEGVRIRRSPMWELHPVLSTNVIVRGVQIVSHGPNNDGCDPEACRDVLIENTVFDTGDDCIAIKSGRNEDGRRLGAPAENIVVRGCTMKDGHGGVTIGSEISGGCRNVFVENCTMDSPNLDRVLRFKSNAVRGGTVENVFVRNVKVGTVGDAVLQIDFLYEEGADGPQRPVVRHVTVENLTVARAKRVLDVQGFPAAEISDVRLHHSTFAGLTQPDVVKDADVKLVDCTVSRKP